MQTEREETSSVRREFGWVFLVAGVAGIVFMGVLLFRQRSFLYNSNIRNSEKEG